MDDKQFRLGLAQLTVTILNMRPELSFSEVFNDLYNVVMKGVKPESKDN